MKKRLGLVLYIGITILLIGCSNPNNLNGSNSSENNSNGDDGNILWEKSEKGYIEKLKFTETIDDGVKRKVLAYSMQEESSGKSLGFLVMKLESNDNIVYKGVIAAARKTESFSQDYWTNYKISCGQSNIIMANTIGGSDKEDEYYEYLIMGGITESQLVALKNANVISISLLNPNYSERNVTFTCDSNFILNLIKYF